MDYKPKALTNDQMKEIAALEPLWGLWGAAGSNDMLGILEGSYCVKFDFISGSPGYCGDLFIIQGDALTDAIPVSLTRDPQGKLQIVEYS